MGWGRKLGALGFAAGLVGWSAATDLPIPGRRHPVVQAALGTAVASAARVDLGLRGQRLRSGLQLGALSAGLVSVGIAAATALAPVRTGMAERILPQPVWRWHAVDIPLGTVWSEETLYRAALGVLAADAFGPRAGRWVQAGAFGLSHVVNARATGEPVLGTVLATGAAGWAFGWLAERSGSILASALAHLAINEAGAVAAVLVQRAISNRD